MGFVVHDLVPLFSPGRGFSVAFIHPPIKPHHITPELGSAGFRVGPDSGGETKVVEGISGAVHRAAVALGMPLLQEIAVAAQTNHHVPHL